MEALEIESQTDQAPLASRRRCPTQGELAEAEDLFDDPDHGSTVHLRAGIVNLFVGKKVTAELERGKRL
jgi:hypothetical protein